LLWHDKLACLTATNETLALSLKGIPTYLAILSFLAITVTLD